MKKSHHFSIRLSFLLLVLIGLSTLSYSNGVITDENCFDAEDLLVAAEGLECDLIIQADDPKIIICHIPPGNPGNPQTIEISENAWAAHEAHGDFLGACDSDNNPDLCLSTSITGGSIAFEGPYSPEGTNTISNTELPSSPFEALGFEYIWLQSEVNVPNTVGNSSWSVVEGSENLTELQISGLSQTMYYIRCARLVGCEDYWGETNTVEVTVNPCLSTSITGGSIAFEGPYNPEGTNTISNTELPSSPFEALGFEYIWLQSEVNVPNTVGNSSWSVVEGSENLTELQINGLLQTMYYIRCARLVGCEDYWGETNTVEVTVNPCLSTSITGGSIAFEGPYNPEGTNTISNTELPSSPFEALGFEYIWLQSEVNVPNTVGNSSWSVVEGSENLTELQISGLSQTMYYIRCARLVGCEDYWGETNTVEVTVNPCLSNHITGGSIAFDGPYNPEGTNTISNTELPSSPFEALGFEYIWLQSEVNVPNTVGNSSWSVVEGSENLTELQISGLLQTMYYIRCARLLGCEDYWGETNTVEVTVNPCLSTSITGGSIAFEGPYNPEGTNTISNTELPSSPFEALGFEYIWLQSEVNVPNTVGNSSWSVVEGSENLTELQISGLLQTMYYIRCARLVGCEDYWGETNTVEVTVNPCLSSHITGGSIAFEGPYNPEGTNTISNTELPSSPFEALGFEYIWLQSEVNVPNTVGNSSWSVVEGSENLTELQISGLLQTMYYIRCARLVGCEDYWGETNTVEVTVNPCLSTSITGGSIAFEGPYNPEGTNTISNTELPSSPFEALGFEYIWLQSEVNVPNTVGNSSWSVVEGSENLNELQISGLSQTMYYIRCARLVGCEDYWGETNTVTVEVIIFETPTALLTGGGQVCPNGTANITITLTGSSPFLVTYSNGTENTEVIVNGHEHSFGASEGQYSLISVSDVNHTGTVQGEAVVATHDIPTASLSDVGEICDTDEEAGIPIFLTGTAPWTFVYSFNGQPFQIETSENDYSIPIISHGEGVYDLISVEDALCSGTTNGITEVSFVKKPTATLSGDASVCNEDDTAEIEINLTGVGPWTLVYTMDGVAQELLIKEPTHSIVANIGQYELVSVSNDICDGIISGSAQISLYEKPTAGISIVGDVCDDQGASIIISLSGTSPWIFAYSFNEKTIQVETAENDYVIPVTPDTQGSYKLISVEDALCSGDAKGTAQVSHTDKPTATLLGGAELCNELETATIEISLTGTGPWTIVYSVDGTNVEVQTLNETYSFEAEVGNYELVSVHNESCSGTISGSAIVSLSERPTATLSGGGTFCSSTQEANIAIDLTGTAPWTVIYSVDGVNVEVETSEEKYNIIGGVGNYELISVSDNLCNGSVSGSAQIVLIDEPTANISGGGTVCDTKEEIKLNINLTGTAPWIVTYTVDGQAQVFTTDNSNHTLNAGIGVYNLISVEDSNCTGTANSSAEVKLLPPFAGTIQLDDTACFGEEIVAEVSGITEGQVIWSVNGGGQLTIINENSASYQPRSAETLIIFTATVTTECDVTILEAQTNVVNVDTEFTISPKTDNYITGVNYLFIPQEESGDSYFWEINNVNIEAQVAEFVFEEADKYSVLLTIEKSGCLFSESLDITVNSNQNLFVPNVFNPQSTNSENKVAKVYGEGIQDDSFLFRIYNRWGKLMYETTSFDRARNIGWDGYTNGELQANGNYTYTVTGYFQNGRPFEKTGTVSIAN